MTLFKQRWPFFAVLFIFIALKIPYLHRAFYWDASWPYASGIRHMFLNNVPSLLPGSIPGELSRGHPLFFHFLGAIWLHIFGTSNVAMHCYALFISCLFLIAIYEAGLRMFNGKVAITATILIAFQQIFFVQSTLVLLEILLAFLGFISVYFYVNKKYMLTAISLTMLFYTKESGMVVGAVLGIDALLTLFKPSVPIQERVRNIVSVTVPVIFIAFFFVLQKIINGWFVLPLYSQGLETHWTGFYNKFREAIKLFFRNDHRKYFFLLLVAVSLAAAFIKKKPRLAIPAVTALIISIICSDAYHSSLPSWLSVPLTIAATLASVYVLCAQLDLNNKQKKFLCLNIIFALSFCVFTSINLFYIDRYLLIALIPVLFSAAVFLIYLSDRVHLYLFVPMLLLLSLIEAWDFAKNRTLGDINMGAFDGLYVHEKIANYFEDHKLNNSNIAAGGFLERIHLSDPYTGFLRDTSMPFNNVKWEIDGATKYVIFDNIEPDTRYDQIKQDSSFHLVYRVNKGLAWGEIYKKTNE